MLNATIDLNLFPLYWNGHKYDYNDFILGNETKQINKNSNSIFLNPRQQNTLNTKKYLCGLCLCQNNSETKFLAQ